MAFCDDVYVSESGEEIYPTDGKRKSHDPSKVEIGISLMMFGSILCLFAMAVLITIEAVGIW